MRILDCKNPACRENIADVPLVKDYLCDDCQEHWDTLQQLLESLGLEYTVDPYPGKGLDYYTKTVFGSNGLPLVPRTPSLAGAATTGSLKNWAASHALEWGLPWGLRGCFWRRRRARNP